MKSQRVLTLGLLSLGLALSACSSSTEPQSSTLWKSSEVGASYLFEGTSTRVTVNDSTTTKTEPGTWSVIVEKSGQSVGGKSNVTTLISESSGALELALEPNGDFSLGDSTYSGWTWLTYPTGSHTTTTLPSFDSLDDYGTRHTLSGSRRYLGDETILLAGRSYTASKVIEETTEVDSSQSYTDRSRNAVTIWWVPELRMFGKFSTDNEHWSESPSSKPYYYRMSTELHLVMYGQHTEQRGGGSAN